MAAGLPHYCPSGNPELCPKDLYQWADKYIKNGSM